MKAQTEDRNRPPSKTPSVAILTAMVCVVLATAVITLYGRTVHYDFVNYDDPVYVYENPYVQQGLTPSTIKWAFGIHGPSMWVPLTWLSHQLVVAAFGPQAPGAHHAINMLLHTINVLLLFVVLRRLTGRFWSSAVAALCWAVHPLHVESIAWITERKDVLCGCFWLLTLLAYECYARKGGLRRYALVCLGTAMALMAKPLAVTLPVILLLLDLWPLRRFEKTGDGRGRVIAARIAEKLPLLALAAFASIMTVRCQMTMRGAIGDTTTYPLVRRLANAVVSYVAYLGDLAWPRDLAVFYPYPAAVDASIAVPAALLLAVLTLGACVAVRRCAYCVTGWFWYLGVLVPMIGLVQAGAQARADRYLYLPAVGIYLLGATMLESWAGQSHRRRLSATLLASVLIIVWMQATWRQVSIWANSTALFEHTLKVTRNNYLAHNNLGLEYRSAGRIPEAREQFLASLEVKPDYVEARSNLGVTLAMEGKYEPAIKALNDAIRTDPSRPRPHYNAGTAYLMLNRPDYAEFCFQRAVKLSPGWFLAHYNHGIALMQLERWDSAGKAFEQALRLQPHHKDAAINLNLVRFQPNQ